MTPTLPQDYEPTRPVELPQAELDAGSQERERRKNLPELVCELEMELADWRRMGLV